MNYPEGGKIIDVCFKTNRCLGGIKMTWEYREEYNKLLEILDQDTRHWRPVLNIPKDGTKVYLKCGVDYKGDTLYDVGYWAVPWETPIFTEEEYNGEFSTEFGNCDIILGWKLVEEKETNE